MKPLYRNGREARLGDQVLFWTQDGEIETGILTAPPDISGNVHLSNGDDAEERPLSDLLPAQDAMLALEWILNRDPDIRLRDFVPVPLNQVS